MSEARFSNIFIEKRALFSSNSNEKHSKTTELLHAGKKIRKKKTRCYAIKKSDVIAFMNDREVNPEKYIAPKNWYKYGSEMVRPYKIRIHPPCAKDEKKLRRYYESKLAALPDVMDVAAAVDFTGYNRRTVCQWIRVGKLKALALLQKYMIPKCYLIDWLCSDDYNNTNRKSRRHIDMLWEVQKWNDMR